MFSSQAINTSSCMFIVFQYLIWHFIYSGYFTNLKSLLYNMKFGFYVGINGINLILETFLQKENE